MLYKRSGSDKGRRLTDNQYGALKKTKVYIVELVNGLHYICFWNTILSTEKYSKPYKTKEDAQSAIDRGEYLDREYLWYSNSTLREDL